MKKIFTAALLAAAVILSGCSAKSSKKTIAVFVPGIMADSPTYAKLAQGVKDGVEKYNSTKPENEKAEVFIMEAGTNQAEWGPKIISLAAAQKYDLIVSSNPSIPALVEPITKQFPKQKFILLDGDLSGNENVHTVSYDQTEQAYFSGYMAGLISKNHKVALIAAQEYPIMNEVLYPNFAKGAQDAFPGTTSEFRVVGNWYDANKGMEISDNLIAEINRLLKYMDRPMCITDCGVTLEEFEANRQEIIRRALADACTVANPRKVAAEDISKILDNIAK